MNMNKLLSIASTLLLLFSFLGAILFTVDERQKAIVLQFGEVVRTIDKPGLHVKIPFLQTVRYFDIRTQTIDPDAPELYNTREKKNLQVDSFVKWRVSDVLLFNVSLGGNFRDAEIRLKQIVNDRLRAEFGQRTIADVIAGERDKVMELVRLSSAEEAKRMGIDVIDVRLKRVDFPDEISDSVFNRMESERRTEANLLRGQGEAEAERIRAEADREKEIILGEAYKKAQTIKGEGDKKAANLYAGSFSKNPEFYNFWRSMEAYKASFKDKNDVMVLDASSDFFKHMKTP
jgi:membrane protease subunit HflC